MARRYRGSGFGVNVSVEIDTRRMLDDMVDAAGQRTSVLVERIGQEMVTEVEEIVSSRLPSTENSKPNQTSLANSFTYTVERGPGRGGYPWRVSLSLKPGVSKGKVAALNWGANPKPNNYIIRPRNVPRALEFRGLTPDPAYYKVKKDGTVSMPSGQYAGRVLRPLARRTSTSGPREGHFFLEEARANVLERYGISESGW